MADVITCSSGLTGRVRDMKVREECVLADRKLAESGGQIDALLGLYGEEMHRWAVTSSSRSPAASGSAR
jgi:hypothetical protein